MREQISPLFYLCALGLIFAVLLGGGTRGGFLSDVLLQFVSVPILLVALWRAGSRFAIAWATLLPAVLRRDFGCSLGAIGAASALDMDGLARTGDRWSAGTELINRGLPWAPLSLAPAATWLSVLSLLPTFAIFLGVLQLDYAERRLLSLVALAMGFLSVLVGLTQVAQGPSSSLRFFEFTNAQEAVGFFANRNHFAAMLYTLTLLAAAWTGNNGIAFGLEKNRTKFSTASIVSQLASFCILTVLIGAQVVTRSRAGMILALGALFGAFLLIRQGQRATNGMRPTWLMVGAASLAVVLSFQFSLYRALDRFALDTTPDARIAFARNTIEAAKTFMPFGSGVGSFVPVYATFEKPRDLIAGGYANHAHDDFLEIWLETGVAGLILILLFVTWVLWRSLQVWRRSYVGGLQIDRFLVRASTLAILLLLFHSIADYPLRTGSMMALFAFLCALLIPPRDDLISDPPEAARVARTPRPASARLRAESTTTAPRPPRQPAAPPRPARPKPVTAWDDEHWPEEWRRIQARTFEGNGSGKASEPSSEQ